MLLPTHTPGTPEWLRQREHRLGGSEIAAVLGLSPFESRFSLWHRKQNLIPPTADIAVMEWGRRLEPVIADKLFEDHTELIDLGAATFADERRIASLDRWAEDRDGAPVVVEIKTGSTMSGHWDDGIPVWYRAQVQWYLGVTGADHALMAVLLDGRDYAEHRIDRDADDIALMDAAARAFLDSIAANVRPDIDADGHTYDALRQLHPDITDDETEVDPDLAGEYIASKAAVKASEARHQLATNRLMAAMGSCRAAVVDGARIAYRTARRRPDGTPGLPYLQADRKLSKESL